MQNDQTLSNMKCCNMKLRMRTISDSYNPVRMRNAVALWFLFVCCCCFFQHYIFLNLCHHFLIFDEFLIKLSIS